MVVPAVYLRRAGGAADGAAAIAALNFGADDDAAVDDALGAPQRQPATGGSARSCCWKRWLLSRSGATKSTRVAATPCASRARSASSAACRSGGDCAAETMAPPSAGGSEWSWSSMRAMSGETTRLSCEM